MFGFNLQPFDINNFYFHFISETVIHGSFSGSYNLKEGKSFNLHHIYHILFLRNESLNGAHTQGKGISFTEGKRIEAFVNIP